MTQLVTYLTKTHFKIIFYSMSPTTFDALEDLIQTIPMDFNCFIDTKRQGAHLRFFESILAVTVDEAQAEAILRQAQGVAPEDLYGDVLFTFATQTGADVETLTI